MAVNASVISATTINTTQPKTRPRTGAGSRGSTHFRDFDGFRATNRNLNPCSLRRLFPSPSDRMTASLNLAASEVRSIGLSIAGFIFTILGQSKLGVKISNLVAVIFFAAVAAIPKAHRGGLMNLTGILSMGLSVGEIILSVLDIMLKAHNAIFVSISFGGSVLVIILTIASLILQRFILL
ncbi:hypothetical protein CCACVL1_20680 [Corchorus capsularis]|uniref:Uncharacterized protein n=1 Tax=Corchorus capsularis TaxID=210143 RepID=A0A1R3HAC9_COCAP|nr:hypothetical protein CCACVL1_20680 [Corchorus capsularis]